MARRAQVVAVLVLLLALLAAVLWAGAEFGLWLDRRFSETRFVAARPDRLCPLVLIRNEATPMCRAPNGSW